jgi:hypothetical protein
MGFLLFRRDLASGDDSVMTDDLILANAMLVLPGETLRGSLQVRDGLIAAIDHGTAVPPGAIDCHGDFVCPGLVELHTDNLERHISPRPRSTGRTTPPSPRMTRSWPRPASPPSSTRCEWDRSSRARE